MAQNMSRLYVKADSVSFFDEVVKNINFKKIGVDADSVCDRKKKIIYIDEFSSTENDLEKMCKKIKTALYDSFSASGRGIFVADTTDYNVDPFTFGVYYFGVGKVTTFCYEIDDEEERYDMHDETDITDIASWIQYGNLPISSKEKKVLAKYKINVDVNKKKAEEKKSENGVTFFEVTFADEIFETDILDEDSFSGIKETPWYTDFIKQYREGKKCFLIYSQLLDKEDYINWIIKCAGNSVVANAVEWRECDSTNLNICTLINKKTYEYTLKIKDCKSIIGKEYFDEKDPVGMAELLDPFCNELLDKLENNYSKDDMDCFYRIYNKDTFIRSIMEKIPLEKFKEQFELDDKEINDNLYYGFLSEYWVSNKNLEDMRTYIPKSQVNETLFMEEKERIERYVELKNNFRRKLEDLFKENGII